jgi:hypothetical protein
MAQFYQPLAVSQRLLRSLTNAAQGAKIPNELREEQTNPDAVHGNLAHRLLPAPLFG